LTLAGAVSLLGVTLALTGCAVGPRYVRPPVALPETWAEKSAPQIATAARVDSTWWKTFNDPTLDQLVERAFHQNLPLQVAGLRIMEARAQLGLAVGRQYPQIQAALASATAVGITDQAAQQARLQRDFWDYQVGFDAAWEIDFWGRLKSDVRAQTASYLATVADYDNEVVLLTAEVARTYAMIRTFEVLIEQARTNATLQEEGQRLAQARFTHGATSELDVAQATTLLESTRETIPQLQIGLQQSQNALSTLLGQPAGTIQGLAEGPKGIPQAPAEAGISLPAELLRRRPDVRSAELAAVAQCARIGVAKADLYPRFTLFGTIGTQALSNAATLPGQTFSQIFQTGSWFYTFGPRLLWPILDYGRTKSNVRIQDARFQQTLVQYHHTVLKAAQEVEDGLAGYLRSLEAVEFAQKAAAGAKRSVELSVAQYREGAVDFQRVVDAQRSLLEEQNSVARAQSSIATNRIALYKALGGGWEVRQGQAFIPDSTQTEMQHRTNWGNTLSKPPHAELPDTSPSTPR
jgi:NodT family efflux transporter outer membrane factor (OMF) lipoprotein